MANEPKREVWVIEHKGDPVACSVSEGDLRPLNPFEKVRYVPATEQALSVPEPAAYLVHELKEAQAAYSKAASERNDAMDESARRRELLSRIYMWQGRALPAGLFSDLATELNGLSGTPAPEPAASEREGKCRRCGDAYADATVTGCMSCLCFRKAAEAGKAQAEGWVPVGERLPEPCTGAIFCSNGGGVQFGYWDGDADPERFAWHSASGATQYRNNIVTHWMPLPSPPSEASQLPAGETER